MPSFKISNRRIKYSFSFEGKYAIIAGNSGTGKSSLFRLFSDLDGGVRSIQAECDLPVIPLYRDRDEVFLKSEQDVCFIMDENCQLLKRKDIVTLLKESHNYFIIITRKCLDWLPISVDSVFKIVSNGKLHKLEPLVPRFNVKNLGLVDLIITEDRGSSLLFFKRFFPSIVVKSASSKSQIVSTLDYEYKKDRSKRILVVYDAAAFGAQISDFNNFFIDRKPSNVKVLDWESFEWYVLGSVMFDRHYSLADVGLSAESLEQFCTKKLSTIIEYNKSNLPKCMKLDRDCKKCPSSLECGFKTSLPTEEIFVYDSVKTIQSGVQSLNLF